MPLEPKRLQHRLGDGLAALLTLGRVAISVAVDAPSISVLLDKRRRRVERLCPSLVQPQEKK